MAQEEKLTFDEQLKQVDDLIESAFKKNELDKAKGAAEERVDDYIQAIWKLNEVLEDHPSYDDAIVARVYGDAIYLINLLSDDTQGKTALLDSVKANYKQRDKQTVLSVKSTGTTSNNTTGSKQVMLPVLQAFLAQAVKELTAAEKSENKEAILDAYVSVASLLRTVYNHNATPKASVSVVLRQLIDVFALYDKVGKYEPRTTLGDQLHFEKKSPK